MKRRAGRMADLPDIDDHPIIIDLAFSAGTYDGDTVAFKRAVIHKIENLAGLLREAKGCFQGWKDEVELESRIDEALNCTTDNPSQPAAALFAPRTVSHEDLNRPFGPADGSGDWQGFMQRRREAQSPDALPLPKYSCRCPAPRGEPCPLTDAECLARVAANSTSGAP